MKLTKTRVTEPAMSSPEDFERRIEALEDHLRFWERVLHSLLVDGGPAQQELAAMPPLGEKLSQKQEAK